MRYLRPEIGYWLLAALVVAIGLRGRVSRGFAASATVRWLTARRYRASFVRRLPIGLLLAALVLTGLALMDPVLPYSQAEVQSRGLDIVMVLDLSSSMQETMARDKSPRRPQNLEFSSRSVSAVIKPLGKTRLESTKDAIKMFIRSRRDDRIALVVFSDSAYVVSPLTFDYDYLLHYIDLVDDQILRGEGMTAIGDGLALANFLLNQQAKTGERRNQVAVLFTDGENNKGREPADVLKESNDANIRVHFIGVDLEDEVSEKPQVKALFGAVRAYGGRYFNANTERDLDAASRTIDTIEKGYLVNKVSVHDAPVFQWFAVPALICLALAFGVRALPFFIDHT